jgi:hypothetical protein
MRYDTAMGSWIAVNQVIETTVPAAKGRTVTVKKVSARSSNAPALTPVTKVTRSTVPFRAHVNDMAFSEGAWYSASDQGLFVSRDDGLNWIAVALMPAKPGTGLVSTNTSPILAVRVGANDSSVWVVTPKQLEMSGDNGKTWVMQPLPIEPRSSLHFHVNDDHAIVLASDRGVFLSRDSGSSWRQASLSELLIGDLAPVGNAVVVSTADGSLFLTHDGGKTWNHLDGPSDGKLSALRSRDSNNQLIVASATEGLFSLDMGTASSASSKSEAASPVQKW